MTCSLLRVLRKSSRAKGKHFYFPAWPLFSSKVMLELVTWEYKVIPIKTKIHTDHFQVDNKPIIDDVQNDLNALGKEGWELVSIQDISLPDGRMFTVAYLKRACLWATAKIDLTWTSFLWPRVPACPCISLGYSFGRCHSSLFLWRRRWGIYSLRFTSCWSVGLRFSLAPIRLFQRFSLNF